MMVNDDVKEIGHIHIYATIILLLIFYSTVHNYFSDLQPKRK